MLVASLDEPKKDDIVEKPKTTVVLIQNNKNHNAILVATKVDSVIIDKARNYVDLDSSQKAPSALKVMSKKEINERFGGVIKSTPLAPFSIDIFFKNNSIKLTEKSKLELSNIMKKTKINIQKRTPCDISIIGHTDTTGTSSHNQKLAFKRARYLKRLILSLNMADTNRVKVLSYGESDPLIKTDNNISEPKNRRVEIYIK